MVKLLNPKNPFTGNAGLNYAAWQLSRRGWHVMPTIRNAKGSGMIVTDANETASFGVQSKGFYNKPPVPLGAKLENLRSAWWVITTFANSDAPVCYILRLEEVRALANPNKDEFREAWHRLVPNPPVEPPHGG